MDNLGVTFGFNKTQVILPKRDANAAPLNPDIG